MERYVPKFSTRENEFRAYEKSSNEAKDQMVPLVLVEARATWNSLSLGLDLVSQTAGGREVMVERVLTQKPIKSAEELERRRAAENEATVAVGGKPKKPPTPAQLADQDRRRRIKLELNRELRAYSGDGGALRWLEAAYGHPGLIPCFGMDQEGWKEASAVGSSGRPVAIRFDPSSSSQRAGAALWLKELSVPQDCRLILDVGPTRNRVPEAAASVRSAISILAEDAWAPFRKVRKTLMSGSFVSSLRDHPRHLAMEELLLFETLRSEIDFGYGDHASVQPREQRSGGNGFFPHVDLALPDRWIVELVERNGDAQGYVEAASAHVRGDLWHRRTDCWGTDVIETAASGSLVHDGLGLRIPGPWISVRVNQHLACQAARVSEAQGP